MRRTRSLRKMKLPLRRPSTSSSPSGYAAVISWPSSRTRRAIVSSSKTIRLSSRPPVCLRLAVLGNIHSHRRGSWPREIDSTPADSGDPKNGFATRHDRVLRPVAAWHARVHQQPPYGTMPDATQRYQRIPRPQRPHFPCASRNPRRPVPARHALGRRLRRPLHPKLTKPRAPSLFIRHPPHNPSSNVEAVLVHPEIEIGQVAEHAVPGASLEGRGPSRACHILERARA